MAVGSFPLGTIRNPSCDWRWGLASGRTLALVAAGADGPLGGDGIHSFIGTTAYKFGGLEVIYVKTFQLGRVFSNWSRV